MYHKRLQKSSYFVYNIQKYSKTFFFKSKKNNFEFKSKPRKLIRTVQPHEIDFLCQMKTYTGKVCPDINFKSNMNSPRE